MTFLVLAQANLDLESEMRDVLAHAQPTSQPQEPKDAKDSAGDMSQMTSLRLQMAMDRRSKLIETLSNVLKKISDTDSSIVGNLK